MLNFDIVIIGGGVIGLSIARVLKKQGVDKTAVVDRGCVGCEASWAAAGMLAPNLECEAIDNFHRLCTASLGLFPEFADDLLGETGIDIELDQAGTLYLALDDEEASGAMEKYRRQRLADVAVESLSLEEVLELEPLVSSRAQFGLFYPNDWQVENRKLVAALVSFCRQNGVALIENTSVERILTSGGRAKGVQTPAGDMHAEHVVLAAGAWSSLFEGPETKIPVKPIRGQMIAYQGEPGKFRHVIYSHRGYVVPRMDGRILVGATVEDAGFSKENTEEGIQSLEEAALEISPYMADRTANEKWAGLRPYAEGGSPIIGAVSETEGLFIATGHFRNGILLAPITTQIAADFIVDSKRSGLYADFGPERFAPSAKVTGQTNV